MANTTRLLSSDLLKIPDHQLDKINDYYAKHGIAELSAWQRECFASPGVLDDAANLVLSAPTSAGKSLVGDVLLFKTLLERKKKGLIVLPYVAIAEERVRELKPLFIKLGLKIQDYVGSNNNPQIRLENVDVAVCTIEKANNIVIKLIDSKKLSDYGIIVVDEFHMFGDPNRGSLVELLLTKLKYIKSYQSSLQCPQLICMSASISTHCLTIFSQWLNATMYNAEENGHKRPIQLYEMTIVGAKIEVHLGDTENDNSWIKPSMPTQNKLKFWFNNPKIPVDKVPASPLKRSQIKRSPKKLPVPDPKQMQIPNYFKLVKASTSTNLLANEIPANVSLANDSPSTCTSAEVDHDPSDSVKDHNFDPRLVYFAIKTAVENHSALVFCHKKKECAQVADHIAHCIKKILKGDVIEDNKRSKRNGDNVQFVEFMKQKLGVIKSDPKKVKWHKQLQKMSTDSMLIGASEYGVAYHHAGQTFEARAWIEKGFHSKFIRILCATTTLSSGVNLPARRVLIKSPIGYNKKMMNIVDYRQMIGRAGRRGKDELGESILFCSTQKTHEKAVNNLVNESIPNVESHLIEAKTTYFNATITPQFELAILELISNGTLCTKDDLLNYVKSTYFYADRFKKENLSIQQKDAFMAPIDTAFTDAFEKLLNNQLIIVYEDKNVLNVSTTTLGDAIVASGLSISNGLFIKAELEKAELHILNGFNALHILYQVMPIYIVETWWNINWTKYLEIFTKLSQEERDVADSIGITESFIKLAIDIKNQNKYTNLKERFSEEPEYLKQFDNLLRHQRFYGALALNELFNGMSLKDIVAKYDDLNEGDIESAKKDAATFTGMITNFCEKLEWDWMDESLKQCMWLVSSAIDEELLDLKRNHLIQPAVAKLLYRNGKKSLFELAQSKVEDIEAILKQQNSNATAIFAREMVNEAIKIVENDLGVQLDSLLSVQQKESKLQGLKRSQSDWTGNTLSSKRICLDKPKSKLSFFQLLHSDDQKQNTILNSFQPKNSSLILIENYKLFEVTKKADCDLMLDELFPDSKSIDVAIHFTENIITDNKTDGLLIKNCNQMHIKELYLARLEYRQVFCVQSKEIFEYLKSCFASKLTQMKQMRFLTYDVKKALFLLQFGFDLPLDLLMHQIIWHDVSVALWLLDPKWKRPTKDEHEDKLPIDIGNIPLKTILKIAHLPNEADNSDLHRTGILFLLMKHLYQKLVRSNLHKSYALIEIPTRLCIYKMQIKGILIDKELLSSDQDRINRCIETLSQLIYTEAGEEFDLKNRKEINRVLLEKGGARIDFCEQFVASILKNKKRKLINTKKETLAKLQKAFNMGNASNLPTLIIEYRKLIDAKRKLNAMEKAAKSTENGAFIYGKCNEYSSTGRITMYEPNLIGLNKDFEVTSIEESNSHELATESQQLPICPKFSFRTILQAQDGYVFVSADYSQLELRILAHFSGDANLLETVANPDGDAFKSIAASYTGLDIEKIDKTMRQKAKQIFYGINYGMGVKRLANNLEFTIEEAAKYKNIFLARFSDIKTFTEKVIDDCKAKLYIETISQRRRLLPNINNEDKYLSEKAKRQAVNTVIQGTASDILKVSMIAVDEMICKEKLDAALVMQMHDELMYEVNKNDLNEFACRFVKEMEKASNCLIVKLPVKVKFGANWGQLKEIH